MTTNTSLPVCYLRFVRIALISHRMTGQQMETTKQTRTLRLHPPLIRPDPHLRLRLAPPLPTSLNHLALLVSSAPSVTRTGILQWRPKHLHHGRGSRLLDGFPAVLTTKNPRSPGSGGRRSASHVTSVASARSHAGNRPREVWTGHASEFLFPFRTFSSIPLFLFCFRKSDWCSFPVLVNASPVVWIVNSRPSPVAGHVVPVDQLPRKSTRARDSQTLPPHHVRHIPAPPPFRSFDVNRNLYPVHRFNMLSFRSTKNSWYSFAV